MATDTNSNISSNSKSSRIKVAVVQITTHPAFTIDEADYFSEPFIVNDTPILTNLGYYNFDIKDLKTICRDKYFCWQLARLLSILAWFASEESPEQFEKFCETLKAEKTDEEISKNESRMPHVIVFPEGSIPRQSLIWLQRFAKQYKVVIFAGTHAFELGSEARDDYRKLQIVNYDGYKQTPDRNEINQASIDKELQRISNQRLPSIHVLPIIDSTGNIFLRVKRFLSPFEKCQSTPDAIRPDIHDQTKYSANEEDFTYAPQTADIPPQVVEVFLRNYERNPVPVLACICSEALQLRLPDAEYKLLIIPSYNKTDEPFQPIISHVSKNSIPVLFCNDGLYGQSEVRLPVDTRQPSWWLSPPRNGKLPLGDGILLMDIDIDHIGTTVGVHNPRAYYSLLNVAAIIPQNRNLPEYKVFDNVQGIIKKIRDTGTNYFIKTDLSELETELSDLLERESPTPIQRMNLEHMRKLVEKTRNPYRYSWQVHAEDCPVRSINSNLLPQDLKENEIDGSQKREPVSLNDLERELAEHCFYRIVQLLDEPHDQTTDHAKALVDARKKCAEKFDKAFDLSVLPSIINTLNDLKIQVEQEARNRLLHNLGRLVERASATSGWIFLIDEGKNKDPESDILVSFTTHNTTISKQKLFKHEGISGHVFTTGKGYYRNHVKSELGHLKDLYYYEVIADTEACLGIPIFAYEYESDDLPNSESTYPSKLVKKPIGVLNLESRYSGAFWPMHIGELQSAIAMLAPDLMIIKSIREQKINNVWHPQLHGWGIDRIVEKFCLAVATALPSVNKEPVIGCTIWQYDHEKDVLYADGTTRFDYEYLATRILSSDSFTGHVCKGLPRGWVRTLRNNVWSGLNRKEKARRMELQQIKSTPIFNPTYKKQNTNIQWDKQKRLLIDNRERYGALSLYFYDYQSETHGINLEHAFTDNTLKRLAHYVGELIYDCHSLRKKVAVTTLIGRLQEESLPESTIFEILKNTVMEFLRADACSIFLKDENGLACLATTGLDGYNASDPNDLMYQTSDIKTVKDANSKIVETLFKEYKEVNNNMEYGISLYNMQVPHAIVRKLNVQDISEKVRVINRESAAKNENPFVTKYFYPYRKHPETLIPPQSGHHRLLGISITDDTNEVFGLIRVVRRSTSPPFTFHDADLITVLAKESVKAFKDHKKHKEDKMSWKNNNRDTEESLANARYETFVQNTQEQGDGEQEEGKREKSKDFLKEEIRAASRISRHFSGYTRWSTLYIESILNDLLILYKNVGAMTAALRFVTLDAEFNEHLKIFMLRSRFSDQPPEEIYAEPIPRGSSSLGWEAIENGRIIEFKKGCSLYRPISKDSKYVEGGFNIPIRFFSNAHAAVGVLSLNFFNEINYIEIKQDILQKLFLASRKLTCLSDPNVDRDREDIYRSQPRTIKFKSFDAKLSPMKFDIFWFATIQSLENLMRDKQTAEKVQSAKSGEGESSVFLDPEYLEKWNQSHPAIFDDEPITESANHIDPLLDEWWRCRKGNPDNQPPIDRKRLPSTPSKNELELYGAKVNESAGWMIFPLFCGGVLTHYAIVRVETMSTYAKRLIYQFDPACPFIDYCVLAMMDPEKFYNYTIPRADSEQTIDDSNVSDRVRELRKFNLEGYICLIEYTVSSVRSRDDSLGVWKSIVDIIKKIVENIREKAIDFMLVGPIESRLLIKSWLEYRENGGMFRSYIWDSWNNDPGFKKVINDWLDTDKDFASSLASVQGFTMSHQENKISSLDEHIVNAMIESCFKNDNKFFTHLCKDKRLFYQLSDSFSPFLYDLVENECGVSDSVVTFLTCYFHGLFNYAEAIGIIQESDIEPLKSFFKSAFLAFFKDYKQKKAIKDIDEWLTENAWRMHEYYFRQIADIASDVSNKWLSKMNESDWLKNNAFEIVKDEKYKIDIIDAWHPVPTSDFNVNLTDWWR